MNRSLMIIVLASVLLTCSCALADAPKFIPKKMIISTETQKAWALATSAVLTECNGTRHDLLGEVEPTDAIIIQTKKMMYDAWGIANRQDLFNVLRWIDEKGQRIEFEKLGSLISSLNPKQYEEFLAKSKKNPEAHNQVLIVNKYYKSLGQKGILGWDYSRLISLCRWGYLVGYLNESEAWSMIMEAARELQQKFGSWKELGENYIIGREFWSYSATKENGKLYLGAFNKLLSDSNSCWNRIPWKTDLTGVEVSPEDNPLKKKPKQSEQTT
jgi:hypothetical protein